MWTDQPEFVHGAEFIVLHPEHLVSTLHPGANLEAVNPFTGFSIPVLVSGDVQYSYGAQTVLAFPSVVEEHRAMATQFNITPTAQITSIASGEVTLTNSGPPVRSLTPLSQDCCDGPGQEGRYWRSPHKL